MTVQSDRRSRRLSRRSLVSLAATGAVVAGGVAAAVPTMSAGASSPAPAAQRVVQGGQPALPVAHFADALPAVDPNPATPAAQPQEASRSEQRPPLAPVAAPAGTPQQIAMQLLAQRGWADQFSCLDAMWSRESGWNPQAYNASSGAYGIPQALPGGKMASAGADWATNPATQIEWGLDYIASIYGTPCGAWAHWQSASSY